MVTYRLYFMNPASGHIERYDEFEAVDDSAAIDFAAPQAGGQPLELWQHHRKIRRFDVPRMAAFAPSRARPAGGALGA